MTWNSEVIATCDRENVLAAFHASELDAVCIQEWVFSTD